MLFNRVNGKCQISLFKYFQDFLIKIPMSIVIIVNDVDRHLFRE